MLIVCPHCQARYEFPAEQMGGEMLRVRCSACGQVATLLPDGSTQNTAATTRGVDDDSPALSGYSVIQRRSRAPQGLAPVPTNPPAPAVPAPVFTNPPAPAAPAPAAPAPEPPAPEPPALEPPAPEPPALEPSAAADDSWEAGDAMPLDPLEDFGQLPDPSEPPLALPPVAPRDPRRGRTAPLFGGPPESVSVQQRPSSRAPNPVSLGGRDERELDVEPSIIIDMGNLGNRTPPPAATPVPAEPPRPVEFRPMHDAGSPEMHVDIPAIPRRSAGRFFFSVGVFALLGLVIFVWARNDFGDIFQDPGRAANHAFKGGPPTAPPTRPPVVVEPPPPVGRLDTTELTLVPLPKRSSGMLLRGRLSNGTPVAHGAITLRAVLLKDGLPVRERTLPCCDDLDLSAAQAVAQTPGHPHLSTKLNNLGAIQLAPGEQRTFSVVFPDTGDLAPAGLVPLVEVKFSEVVRGP